MFTKTNTEWNMSVISVTYISVDLYASRGSEILDD